VADEKPADPAVVLAGMSAEEKAVLELLGWGGGTHLGVALLWPERWSQAMSGIEALFPKIPIDWGTVRKLIKGAEPLPLVLAAFAEADWDWKAEAPLANWDRARPLVLAFGATDPGLDRPLVPVKEAIGMGMKSAGLSHRLVVPAKDAAALVGELRAILEKMGLADAPELAGLLGVKDGAVLSNGSKAVVVVQGTGFVRIEIVRDEPRDREPDGAGIAVARAAVGAAPESVELTPAVYDMVHGGYTLSAMVSVNRFRKTYIQYTNEVIHGALSNAVASERDRLGAMGASEVLQGYALMAPETAMHDRVSAGIAFSKQGVRGRLVADLTPLGRSAAQAASQSAAAAGFVVEGQPMASLLLRMNFRAAAAAARLPVVLQPREGEKAKLQDVVNLMRNCGSICNLYFALDGGLGLVAALARPGLIPMIPDPAAMLPSGVSATVLNFGPSGVTAVLAGAYPTAKEASDAQLVLGPFLRDLSADLSLSVVEDRGFHWLVASIGGAAAKPGSPTDASTGITVGQLSLDLQAWAAGIAGLGPQAAVFQPVLGRLEGRSARAGMALVSGFSFLLPGASADGVREPEPVPLLPVPGPVESDSKLLTCEERILLAVIEPLAALGQAEPALVGEIGVRAAQSLKEASACASAYPDLAKAGGEVLVLLSERVRALSAKPEPAAATAGPNG
jgi:hypothetical protein